MMNGETVKAGELQGVGRYDDARLACEAVAGSRDAFGELVLRHHAALRCFLAGILRNRAAADDIAQEAFIKAFRCVGAYEPSSSFKTWLFTIGKRLALNHIRDEKGKVEVEDDGWFDRNPSTHPGPSDSLEGGESSGELAQALHSLAEEQREALWLHYQERMPVKEIAVVLGKSLVATKVLMFRARRRLAGVLRGNARVGVSVAGLAALTP